MDKTPDEIANEAIMTRQVCEALILLVEGYNDGKTYQKFFAFADSEIISSWGKDNVLGAIAIIENENIYGVLGIVDADFWHLDGPPPIGPNVLVTDEHDLEMMIIRSNSFFHFMAEVASAKKLERFLRSHGMHDIREILLEIALPIGLLRRYSHDKELRLCFEGMKFNSFIKKDTIELELNKMVEMVLSLTGNPALKLAEITGVVRTLLDNANGDPFKLCCGHDVMEILGVGLRKCIGSKSKEAASLKVLESELRMSYDSACFRKTRLYKEAKKWSQTNAPYEVFS